MKLGNTYYITNAYNEKKFKALVEQQLNKDSSCFPSNELIEQAIAALLECKESGIVDKAVAQMENRIKCIVFTDNRDYTKSSVVGNPLEAINAFNQLMVMYELA